MTVNTVSYCSGETLLLDKVAAAAAAIPDGRIPSALQQVPAK
jgi:hypothetical protein